MRQFILDTVLFSETSVGEAQMFLKKLKLTGQNMVLLFAKKYEHKHVTNGGESGFFCAL
jgi:hypothetical protein